MSKKTLLYVDSSARIERSYSRRLGKLFVDAWRSAWPNGQIVYRDVGVDAPPLISQDWIAAAFTPPQDRTSTMREVLAYSDALIDEIEKADVIALGAPMYNYNMPASLKAWFDQIARVGRTFSFDLSRGDYPIEPILTGKKLVVLSSRGEFGYIGGVRAHMNALDMGISACAHYLGAKAAEIVTIAVEYQEFGGERHAKSLAEAEAAVLRTVGELSEQPATV